MRNNKRQNKPEIQKEPKQTGLDYNNTVFIEKSKTLSVIKTYKLKSRTAHLALLDEIKKRKNTLWYASVIEDNKKFYASNFHIVDFDSVPDEAMSIKTWKGELFCPFCNKSVSSTQGRTLHVQHEHPTRLEEYKLALISLKESMMSNESESPVTTPETPCAETPCTETPCTETPHVAKSYKCPYCDTVTSSTPGRTLHVKSRHPDKLEEYKSTKH